MRHAKTAVVSYRQLSWPHWAVVEQGLRSYPYFCFWQAWARSSIRKDVAASLASSHPTDARRAIALPVWENGEVALRNPSNGTAVRAQCQEMGFRLAGKSRRKPRKRIDDRCGREPAAAEPNPAL